MIGNYGLNSITTVNYHFCLAFLEMSSYDDYEEIGEEIGFPCIEKEQPQ